MKIFNTLTRSKEEFKPIEPGKVRMYVCGPTVYNYIHIGNARPMIVFDTFRRYLLHKGYDVNYVSNFTDVDDKIIKAAIEQGIDPSEVSERFIKECKADMASLNVMPATTHPQATKEIDGMIDMIATLIDKGHAYVAEDGTVYYKTRSFKDYGKLSHKNLDDLEGGHRDDAHALKVDGADAKQDALDFVLWKPKKDGEPYWESPWCQGRPGWHIECSVMSKRYLGDEIDIHAGGEDLIFPHHENEIAQSEAANGCEFSHYWMHNGFLNIDGAKMSKSAGNFFTVREILEKYEAKVLRFFMLSAHYRSPLNFADTLMETAKVSMARVETCIGSLMDLVSEEESGADISELNSYVEKFDAAMDDDCNTADAISVIFELVKYANVAMRNGLKGKEAKTVLDTLTELWGVLGLEYVKEDTAGADEDTAWILELIEKRTAAKKAKDFAGADAIRDELLSKGIAIKDTREGVKWERI